MTDVADHDARDDVVYGGVSVASLGLLVSSGTATLSGFLEDASGAVIEHAFSSGVGGVRGLVSGDLHGHGHVDDVRCATTDSAAPIYRVALPRLFRDPAPVSVQHIALTLAGGDLLAQDPNDEVFTIDSVTQDLLVLGYDSELVLAERAYSPFRAQQCVVSVDGDGDGEVDDLMHLVPSADGLLILGVAIITSSTDLVGQRPSQTGFLDIDPNDLGSVPLGGQVDRIVSGSLSLVGSRVQAKTVVLAGGAGWSSSSRRTGSSATRPRSATSSRPRSATSGPGTTARARR